MQEILSGALAEAVTIQPDLAGRIVYPATFDALGY
jgi:hypothetical protein